MKIPSRSAFGAVLLLGATALLSSCGSASETAGALFVSDSDEVVIGQKYDADLRANPTEYPLYNTTSANHRRVKAYVDSIVHNILQQVPEDERPAYFSNFKVTLIDKNVVNAFAVPGGFVYVYTGIIDSLDNEAELAAILGHEMTHVVHHHYRAQLVEQFGIDYILSGVGGDSSALASVAKGLLSLKLSRDHETDADENGTILAGAAQYNPLGVATFFARMPNAPLEILSDHPNSSTRIDAVTAQVKASPTLSALAWSDAAKTVVRTDDQYRDRFLSMRAIVH